jgi:hypothetical protein
MRRGVVALLAVLLLAGCCPKPPFFLPCRTAEACER